MGLFGNFTNDFRWVVVTVKSQKSAKRFMHFHHLLAPQNILAKGPDALGKFLFILRKKLSIVP